VLDILKSLAYHGFKKMIIVNGHGSNGPLIDIASRRLIVETDASCAFCGWWQLLQVDPDFKDKWRESQFPGGCSHAGELETSMLLHLDPDSVRKDKIKSEIAKTNKMGSKYVWGDLFGKGPMGLIEWTSQYSDSGVMGEAEKGTAEKGKLVFEEASRNLAEFIAEYHERKIEERTKHQATEPTIPLSF
jgi:creatinine amidohydrolase